MNEASCHPALETRFRRIPTTNDLEGRVTWRLVTFIFVIVRSHWCMPINFETSGPSPPHALSRALAPILYLVRGSWWIRAPRRLMRSATSTRAYTVFGSWILVDKGPSPPHALCHEHSRLYCIWFVAPGGSGPPPTHALCHEHSRRPALTVTD
ncbi:hypothetical protein J6590_029718 [Homalodisca vitripennis]|nr:hypothetical protein J6590_029718 [Homalodisca vitripennis]